ncbi:MAG: hypothetical protein MZW92_64645 [Comamonadaceae bacterium]|nr:hypothetical protein [Comamonadaceae bacterium]
MPLLVEVGVGRELGRGALRSDAARTRDMRTFVIKPGAGAAAARAHGRAARPAADALRVLRRRGRAGR